MRLVKCPKEHFYDADAFASCPHCAAAAAAGGDNVTVPLGGTRTASTAQNPVPAPQAPAADGMPAGRPVSNDADTIRQNAQNMPPLAGNDWRMDPATDVTMPATPREDNVTIGVFSAQKKETGFEPVVGWLVVVEGQEKGRDYRLKSARNFIGRSAEMDVCLAGDNHVSRSRHAVVVYEPKSRTFLAQPGDSSELFYVNDQVVLAPVALKRGDRIQIGSTVLMLVPLCDEHFSWDLQNS